MASSGNEVSHDPLIGALLGERFRIVRLIDRGGMGRVYEGVQEPLGRTVAVKTLDMADPRGEFRKRFFNEAKVCSRLKHPNTIRIHDYGSTPDGVYYFAMELLDGRTLREALRDEGPVPAQRAIHVMRQIIGALSEAHDHGVVHRDLKPSNIFLCRHSDNEDFVKVLDFGLVKELASEISLSRRDVVIGSPMYMAPEQVENHDVDQRADVYALGLLLWTILAGRVPFSGKSPQALLLKQLSKDPPKLHEVLGAHHEVPAALEQLIELAIRKDPSHRIQSARELGRGLGLIQRALTGERPPPRFELVRGRLLVYDDPESTEARALGPETLSDESTVKITGHTSTSTRSPWLAAAGVALFTGSGVVTAAMLVAILVGGWLWFGATVTPSDVEAQVAKPPPSARWVVIESYPLGGTVSLDGVSLGMAPLQVKSTEGAPKVYQIQGTGGGQVFVVVDGTQDVVRGTLPQTRRVQRPREVIPEERPEKTPKRPRSNSSDEVRDPWSQ
jgi:serine/threonine protein kinase